MRVRGTRAAMAVDVRIQNESRYRLTNVIHVINIPQGVVFIARNRAQRTFYLAQARWRALSTGRPWHYSYTRREFSVVNVRPVTRKSRRTRAGIASSRDVADKCKADGLISRSTDKARLNARARTRARTRTSPLAICVPLKYMKSSVSDIYLPRYPERRILSRKLAVSRRSFTGGGDEVR